jgi:hypothetical protein
MSKFKTYLRGYLAARKDKGILVIWVSWPESPTKRYLIAGLNEALDVPTGKQAFTRLKEKVKGSMKVKK